jgi:hypothetical protein
MLTPSVRHPSLPKLDLNACDPVSLGTLTGGIFHYNVITDHIAMSF